MKIVAIIIAGGVGSRVGTKTPKQYIEIFGKPVIVYTIEEFQRNNNINDIYIVCGHGWKKHVTELVEKYNLNKVRGICYGGETGLDSIWNALMFTENKYSDEDVFIIQDANRCLTTQDIINDGIRVCLENSSAISGLAQVNSQVYIDSGNQVLVDRDKVFELHRPEFFTFKKIKYVRDLTKIKQFNSPNPVSILIENGEKIFLSSGNSLNMKITYPEDLELVEAILSLNKNN